MTGGDSTKAEIEIDMGGDVVAQMKELAKATDKAADAEEEYQKLLAKRQKVFSGLATQRVKEESRAEKEVSRQREAEEKRRQRVTSGLAKQRTQEEARAEQQRQREQERRERVLSSLATQRVQEESRAEAQRKRTFASSDAGIAQRRMERVEQEKRVKERMEFLGYGPKERESVEEEAQRKHVARQRQAEVSSRMKELSGEGEEITTSPLKGAGHELAHSLGVMTTRAAAIAAVVQAGRGALATGAELARDPYLSKDAAAMQGYRKYAPFIGDMVTDAGDLWGTGGKRASENRLLTDEKAARMQSRLAIWRTRQDTDIDAGSAADVAKNVARLNPLPGLPDGARSTASEKQRYEFANRIFEVEKRITQARREQYGVTARIAQTDEAMEAEKVRMAELIEDRASLERSRQNLDRQDSSAGHKEIEGKRIAGLQLLKEQEIEESRRAMFGYTQQRQQLGIQNQEAGGRVREAEYGRTEARLADLQQREGEAGPAAARLAFAGPEGRLRGQYAAQFIGSAGIANAPSDIAADYQRFFPKEAQARAEQEGGQFVGDFRKLGAADYRDDLGSVRGQIDKLKQEQQQEGEKIAQALKDGIAEAFKGVGAALSEILKQTGDDAWKKKVAEETARAFSQGR